MNKHNQKKTATKSEEENCPEQHQKVFKK